MKKDDREIHPHLRRMKREAKEMVRNDGVKHMRALDIVAREHGYSDWDAARRSYP